LSGSIIFVSPGVFCGLFFYRKGALRDTDCLSRISDQKVAFNEVRHGLFADGAGPISNFFHQRLPILE